MITNLAQRHQGFTSNVFLVTGDRTVLVDVGNGFDVVGDEPSGPEHTPRAGRGDKTVSVRSHAEPVTYLLAIERI